MNQKYIVTETFGYNDRIMNKHTVFEKEVVKFDDLTIAWLKNNGSIKEYDGSEIIKEPEIINEDKQIEDNSIEDTIKEEENQSKVNKKKKSKKVEK